jgi:formylglycine-generating enzyme required for sulfatase activity
MVGNVEEWTATPSAGGKVILGGSWAMTCMVYGLPVFRRVALPNFYSNDLGFRCAKDAADRR